jgi:hypothetical protein
MTPTNLMHNEKSILSGRGVTRTMSELQFYLYGLSHILKMQGLSTGDVASLMGRSISYRNNINNWRKYERKCTLRIAQELAQCLSVDVNDLVKEPNLVDAVNQLTYTIRDYSRVLKICNM